MNTKCLVCILTENACAYKARNLWKPLSLQPARLPLNRLEGYIDYTGDKINLGNRSNIVSSRSILTKEKAFFGISLTCH